TSKELAESETEHREAKGAPRRGLGRGLSALIPSAQTAAALAPESKPLQGPGEAIEGLRTIPLTRIALNPFQPRTQFEPQQLDELTASVRHHGVLQPIVVRPKKGGVYELVAGERRFRAATSAGLTEIPAVVRQLTDEESLALALIENIQREDLNPVEAARAYRRLIDEFGLTQMELAGEIGKSQSSIANSIRLLSLPEGVLESLSEGLITEGHAKAILTVDGEPRQLALRREIIDKRLSVRETERRALAIRRHKNIPRGIISPDLASVPPADLDIRAIESELSTMLGTGVRFKYLSNQRGRIEIDFYDGEQMEGVIQRLLDLRSGLG
ncbi:MAG TPA: ParB/RepB/Spo0J family partition protein, partial [Capsulimonadaceae bacterium]|nr:ParB/RepB/Spo0J family partition protein [Capsulimonadaceae bacterium]